MRIWTGALLVAAALVTLPALPATAGVDGGSQPTLTIRKVVNGPVPAGTQFGYTG